eukprot:c18034_g2_i1 orf=98-349(-)
MPSKDEGKEPALAEPIEAMVSNLKQLVVFIKHLSFNESLSACKLGDGLCTLRHCMLGKLSRQDETHSSLNLPASYGRLLVVTS